MTWLPLLVIGIIFILVMLGIRYYTYRTMTERVCSLEPDSDYCQKHFKSSKTDTKDLQVEVVEGKTAHGGVKTEIHYLDAQNRPVKKSKAEKVILRELDEKGKPVHEAWDYFGEGE